MANRGNKQLVFITCPQKFDIAFVTQFCANA